MSLPTPHFGPPSSTEKIWVIVSPQRWVRRVTRVGGSGPVRRGRTCGGTVVRADLSRVTGFQTSSEGVDQRRVRLFVLVVSPNCYGEFYVSFCCRYFVGDMDVC